MEERNWILVLILFAGLAGGGVYMYSLSKSLSGEPAPQHAAEIARTRLTEAALQPSQPKETVKLYFPSFEQGALIEESRPISWATSDADRIRQVVLALIEGSHQGLARSLPPNASIRGVFIPSEGTAVLDFSHESFEDFSTGIERESLLLDSLVNSITTNVPRIQRVRILVQGQDTDTLDGHADLGQALVPDMTRVAANP